MPVTSFEDLIVGNVEKEMLESKARLTGFIHASYNAYAKNQGSPDNRRELSHAMENLISEVNNLVTKKNILVTLQEAFDELAPKGDVVHSEGGRKSRRRKKTNRRE